MSFSVVGVQSELKDRPVVTFCEYRHKIDSHLLQEGFRHVIRKRPTEDYISSYNHYIYVF